MDFMFNSASLPAGAPNHGLGIRRHTGVELPETRGLHPIHVTEATPGVLAGERIKKGDVILGIEDEPLGPNPARQFSQIVARESRDSGIVWIAR